MSHAYSRNYVHLVFATKDRRRVIKEPVQQKMWPYLASIAQEYGITVNAIGGGEDHVHLLLGIPPKLSIATIVRALKANSSKWMNETGHWFAWQAGYGVFSVSVSNLSAVAKYIGDQAEHHKTRNFEEEYFALLRKHGVDFSPDHVFG
jgi:putative transposase